MNLDTGRCPLCGLNVVENGGFTDTITRVLNCRRCGHLSITIEALYDPAREHWALRCATRQAFDAGRPLSLRAADLAMLAEQHSHTTVQENADKLLNHIARRCPRPGQREQFDADMDYPVIDARDARELMFFVDYLKTEKLVSGPRNTWEVTVPGWAHLAGPTGAGYIPGQCFVAMSFLREHDSIYRDGIEPAIRDAGYEPVCMKDVLTNEDINFRILSELRQAEIVVADFTGKRGGVYFEAGFALALRREVFWTCAETDKDEVHFDTKHFQYIFWRDHSDLKQQLSEKILAIHGPGPNKRRE